MAYERQKQTKNATVLILNISAFSEAFTAPQEGCRAMQPVNQLPWMPSICHSSLPHSLWYLTVGIPSWSVGANGQIYQLGNSF